MIASTIGAILPLAVGVAISPIPLIATLLMLMSPRAKTTASAFAVGWLVGCAAVTSLCVVVAGSLSPSGSDESGPVPAAAKIVLGLALLGLALRAWLSRPGAEDEPVLPGWMSAIDAFGAAKAGLLGCALAGANPKNFALAASAGLTIGGVGLSTGGLVLSVAVFTLLASISVVGLVVVNLVAAGRIAGTLSSLRAWLERYNGVVMAVLLSVIGAQVLGQGIAAV